VGIDSDGCVFPTVEIKQRKGLWPAALEIWPLRAAAKEFRLAAEWVTLFSEYRGVNRFQALRIILNLLEQNPDVKQRGIPIRQTKDLEEYLNSGLPLSNRTLRFYTAEHPELKDVLNWSLIADRYISRTAGRIKPFPGVRKTLSAIRKKADSVVISTTATGTLRREWRENGLAEMVDLIVGPEYGTKAAILKILAGCGYESQKILMLGDTRQDLDAARENNGFFYPIRPGREKESWKRFQTEALDRFSRGKYSAAYEAGLVRKWQKTFTSCPPWKNKDTTKTRKKNFTISNKSCSCQACLA